MKYVVLLILILTLLTVDLPLVQQLRNQLITLVGLAAEQEYGDDETASKIRQLVTSHFNQFSDKEEAYIKPAISSSRQLKAFYQSYCIKPQFNPRLSSQNVTLVCKHIHNHIDEVEAELIRRHPGRQKSS